MSGNSFYGPLEDPAENDEHPERVGFFTSHALQPMHTDVSVKKPTCSGVLVVARVSRRVLQRSVEAVAAHGFSSSLCNAEGASCPDRFPCTP